MLAAEVIVVVIFVWFGLSLPSLATRTTYQTSGDCPNLFCNNSKIIFHFLLAKLASPTATRHSRDSMPGKQAGKTFRLASFSGDQSPGKARRMIARGTYQERNPSGKPKQKGQGKGKDRKGREVKGREGRNGYAENLLPFPIKYPQQVASPLLRWLASFTGCSGKNRIITAV